MIEHENNVATRRRFWSVPELAAYLQVPRTWIYDRTQARGPERIPHCKFGKYVRFDPESEAFRAWLRGTFRG